VAKCRECETRASLFRAESVGIDCMDFLQREPNVEAQHTATWRKLTRCHDECRGERLRVLELAQRSLLQ
jgi:hypothetical protein